MEINEAQVKKELLLKNINAMLMQFSMDTGLIVTNIDVMPITDYGRLIGNGKIVSYEVEARVEL